ncbi:NAD(P)-binding protein [Epithele typhae]|uniref:NAD(P)-binding protein n=1 Tax=Epithele typhae TaxID=378194 RepID=UPI00200792E0|nr:NAD(P)-binding protein [Epithele typhae]KAH9933635.1 NAD(P)-binding protein [Epithele typhae]
MQRFLKVRALDCPKPPSADVLGRSQALNPPVLPKVEDPLRFGILGAARIGPDALFTPAKTHPGVVVTAVACRDKARGDKYANKHKVEKVFAGQTCYQGRCHLLDDKDVDAVYIPLPNGLHFEWTMRAIDAGKHVLVEKPITNTADEARAIFARAAQKGVVVLEAVHFTFHPATQRVREIVASGELGKIKSAKAWFTVPTLMGPFIWEKNDIRYDFDLGGGSTMDQGVYPLTAIRYFTGTDEVLPEVTFAKAIGMPSDAKRVDRAMHAAFKLPSPLGAEAAGEALTGETICDFSDPGWGPFGLFPHMPKFNAEVTLEGGKVEYFNFIVPALYHSITVRPSKGEARTERVYVSKDGYGEPYWSTYRYQLEAFVDKVRGRTPQYWPTPETTITKMECVEMIYEKAEMPPRPASSYKAP